MRTEQRSQPAVWDSLAEFLDLAYQVQQNPTDAAAAEFAELVRLIDRNGLADPYAPIRGLYAAFTCSDTDLPRYPLA